jgi:hypothetical protein
MNIQKSHRIALYIACIGILSMLTTPAFAAISTPSATPKAANTSTASAQLEELKVRLATKVAELRSVVKRAMFGTVKTISLTSATVETKTKDIKIELTDDVTVSQVISGKRVNLDLEKLEVKDPITVFGTYDEALDLLKAQYIFIESAAQTSRITGVIADVDSEEFSLIVNTADGRSITVDIEKSTKTTAWTAASGITKAGFSKLAVGDSVHIVGIPVPKKENRISASRILDLGNITGAAGAPTTTPIPDASPSATVKATPKPTVTPAETP